MDNALPLLQIQPHPPPVRKIYEKYASAQRTAPVGHKPNRSVQIRYFMAHFMISHTHNIYKDLGTSPHISCTVV